MDWSIVVLVLGIVWGVVAFAALGVWSADNKEQNQLRRAELNRPPRTLSDLMGAKVNRDDS